mgnify:FL=1
MTLFGNFDKNRKYIEERFNTKIKLKEDAIDVTGEGINVEFTKELIIELLNEINKNGNLEFQKIKYHADMLERENKDVIKQALDDSIIITATGKPIKPKTLGQQSYIDKIKNNDVVFGIGPAGTGKTYLAVAMAVRSFKQGEVNRIILTRPAVEAGESLGFLPCLLYTSPSPRDS